MNLTVLIGSLIAILALAGLAAWLKLGHDPILASEADARRVANETVEGFEPVRTGLDRNGRGGLLQDSEGRVLLLKPHGNFFAGRLLGPRTAAAIEGDALIVDCGERTYGTVALQLDDAAYWADVIHRLKTAS